MREGNTLGPVRVGAIEIAGTGVVGMEEIETIGTTKIGAKSMVETSATSAVGEVVVGISVSAVTPGSSKVFAIRRMDMQNKGRPQQSCDTNIYMYEKEITKTKTKNKKKQKKMGGKN